MGRAFLQRARPFAYLKGAVAVSETNHGAAVEVDDSTDALTEWEPWGAEETEAGLQGTFLPTEAAGASVSEQLGALDLSHLDTDTYASPEERAQARFDRLSTAFSATLLIVGQMHRDEDWKYLKKADGGSYRSLVEVCQDAMGKSAAMARRYVQGARDFYLPLSEVMVEGTRLEITSGDVATLGTGGLREVVDSARERLAGVEDPEAATAIINDTLDEARTARDERKAGTRAPEAFQEDDGDDGWGDDMGREYHESPTGDALGPVYTGTEDEDSPGPQRAQAGATTGSDLFESADDLVAPLLAGAPLFDDSATFDALPSPVQRAVQAMQVLESVDLTDVAQHLTYENRGVIVHTDRAQRALARLRSLAESQPWVVRRIGEGAD